MRLESVNLGRMINSVMVRMMLVQMDVAEMHSPPRVAATAKEMSLQAGWSLDLTTIDEHGQPWDFSKDDMQERALEKIMGNMQSLMVGYQMCTNFSIMMHLNWAKMKQEDKEKRTKKARERET